MRRSVSLAFEIAENAAEGRWRGNTDRSLLEASHVYKVANPNLHLGVLCRRHASSDECCPASPRSRSATRLELAREGRPVRIALARAGGAEFAILRKVGRRIDEAHFLNPRRHCRHRAAVADFVREPLSTVLWAWRVLSRTIVECSACAALRLSPANRSTIN